MPGDAKDDEQEERVEGLDALQDEVAAAAEAAAASAAHAVAAARAIEEISKAREEAEATAAKTEANPRAKSTGSQMAEPALGLRASDAETEPTVSTGDSSAPSADEEFNDLLNLDSPDVAMPSVLTRIALMALGVAAAIFVVSFLLVSTVPQGTILDVIILVTWLSVAVLALGGFALLAAAGIAKVTRSGDRA